MKQFLRLTLLLLSFTAMNAQELWKPIAENRVNGARFERVSQPSAYKIYQLDLADMKTRLSQAPMRTAMQSNLVLSFPDFDGNLQRFSIFEAPVMHEELSARYPDIKSYVGKGIDDKTATIRFSVTMFGLHAMTFSAGKGTWYIDTYSKDLSSYIVYSRRSLTTTNTFECSFVERPEDVLVDFPEGANLAQSNNSLFKTYRLAMACTIEYAAFHINAAGLGAGTTEQKKAAVLAAMNVTMTRVDGIYERDFALTMVLIPNNDALIFIDSDNFDNANTNNILLDQSQSEIDAIIGTANYDIGHTVSTGGGGVAQLQSPCTGSKARGITGLDAPVGDPYDVDYVSHEMGHQWGCAHTFNGDQGACSGNRTNSSAFEPGSGSTIMGYSGICNNQNVQDFSDDYFHARSLIQGSNFINGTGNCGVVVPNNNLPPTVDAGPNYTIPFGTAFKLTGTASDPDGDAITYCWEQYDNDISTQPPVATSTGGPNFRTFDPSTSPVRYFPNMASVLANNLTPTWEVVPNVARSMDFSLVVRDNGSPLGGQTERDVNIVTLANTGPFKVTSQNALEAWAQGSSQTVTWDVAGTTANGINTAFVNIKMSADGGATWPYVLAENTLNDGSESIIAPNVVSQNCRILIEAVENIYFAVNSKAFAVGYQVVTVCETYDYTTAFTLPANSSSFTVRSISVPLTGTISDVNIHVNATHPNLQNLNMAVIRPGGAIMNYYNQQCDGSANMDVTFDQQGAAFACGSPLTGTIQPPVNSLDTLNGFSATGTWQFGFRDVTNAAQAGSIDSFSLEVCASTLEPLATQAFSFEHFALYPNPNNGSFTVRFDRQDSQEVQIPVVDLHGRKLFDQHYTQGGMFQQEVKLDQSASGTYLVTVKSGDAKIVKRIVIQ